MTQPTETELKLRRDITTLEQEILEKTAENIKLRKQIEFLTLTTNEAGAKISKLTQDVEDAKKEADKLMMNKIRFYEEELNKLRKSGL